MDRKFEIDSSEWVNVQRDPGGDHSYRHLWPKVTKMVDPEAVIYVLDGRKPLEQVEEDINECLHESLSEYERGGRLKLIYVFVNFYDVWQTDEHKQDVLFSQIQYVAAKKKYTYPALRGIDLKAEPTHINPVASNWPELNRALEHFATDLNRLT